MFCEELLLLPVLDALFCRNACGHSNQCTAAQSATSGVPTDSNSYAKDSNRGVCSAVEV